MAIGLNRGDWENALANLMSTDSAIPKAAFPPPLVVPDAFNTRPPGLKTRFEWDPANIQVGGRLRNTRRKRRKGQERGPRDYHRQQFLKFLAAFKHGGLHYPRHDSLKARAGSFVRTVPARVPFEGRTVPRISEFPQPKCQLWSRTSAPQAETGLRSRLSQPLQTESHCYRPRPREAQ